MNNILEELYYGKLCSSEHFVPNNEEYEKQKKIALTLYKEFIAELTPPLGSQFNDLLDAQASVDSAMHKQAFLYGFQLGANMMKGTDTMK